jgi:hypothetical protein
LKSRFWKCSKNSVRKWSEKCGEKSGKKFGQFVCIISSYFTTNSQEIVRKIIRQFVSKLLTDLSQIFAKNVTDNLRHFCGNIPRYFAVITGSVG